MPTDIQPNGLLSQLVGLKAQKEAQQKTDQIGIWKTIAAKDSGFSDSQREMAAVNLKALAGDVLGGGSGTGGSRGRSGGGTSGSSKPGSPGDFFTQLFHKAVDHLHKGGGQGQQPQQQQPAAPPQPVLQTQEQMQARQGEIDKQAAVIANAIAVQKQAALAQQKRVDDQQYHEDRMEEGQALGLTGIQLAEYADPDKRTLTAEHAAPKETATDVAEQAYADTEGKPKKDLTAAEKIAAVRAARGTAKAPTKEEVAYAEKHGKKPEELTGSEKLLAVKEARETERLPQRPALQSGTGGTGGTGYDISDDELRSLAEKEILTGSKPSFGLGKSAVRDRYNKIMADVWASDPDSAEARAAYRAGMANLTQLTRLKGQVSSFETAFELDADNAQDAAKDVPRTSMRKFNSVAQLLERDWTDDPALATLAVNVQTVVNQYARLVSSATGGGVSTDSARQEAMVILDKSMASGSFSAAINRMKLEARNRITGLNKEIESAKTGMRRGSGSGTDGSKDKTGSAQPKTADELLKSLGKGQ